MRKLATWQESKNLDADGKAGSFTLQWLSQQPTGKGLEAHVSSNATVYLGMNPAARTRESAALKASAGGNVTSVPGSSNQDTARAGTSTADLGTPKGRKDFVNSIPGLDPSRTTDLEKFLENSDPNTKDELAQLIVLLNEAETGKRLIVRGRAN